MNKIKELLRYGFIAFILVGIVSLFTSEYQGKWKLKNNAVAGRAFSAFTEEYGKETYYYPYWESLPLEYRDLFDQKEKEPSSYYSYQMEGFPSYWGFLISVNDETEKIQRYVIIDAIALEPI